MSLHDNLILIFSFIFLSSLPANIRLCRRRLPTAALPTLFRVATSVSNRTSLPPLLQSKHHVLLIPSKG
ncbi:hypothetical protein ACOSP7_017882 [Xanthoceras sorbifolium]